MCNLSLYEVVVLMSYRLMRWSLMFGDLGCRKRLFRSLRVQRLEMFSFSERGPGFGLQDFVMANVTLRLRLANGLQTTHVTLGNLQLVAQYLTVLGNLALSLHDIGQAQQLWPWHLVLWDSSRCSPSLSTRCTLCFYIVSLNVKAYMRRGTARESLHFVKEALQACS
ncbi:uncharacterized protein LOC141664409 isoform X2 [Apium graveolens]|uniref:uncharacterized protein LOC141664409 isoform X2 n=2 Tax=Apium graveolens TaxID=4045 RepID=UPI003D7BCE1F